MVLFVDEKLTLVEKQKLIRRYNADCIITDDKYAEEAQLLQIHFPKAKLISLTKAIDSSMSSVILEDINENDPAFCVYTSGSTGEPKGIVSTHKNVIFGANSLDVSLELSNTDRLLGVTPFSGTNGQVFTIWTTIYTGGSAVYYQGMFTPFTLFKQIDRYQTTWLNATPTYYSIIVKSGIKKSDVNIESMKFVRTSSAPMPPSVQEAFEREFFLPMADSLGMSETAGQLFVNGRNVRRRGSVGKAVNVNFQIRDSSGVDITEQTYDGETAGELWVQCDGLMPGYLDDNEQTNNVIQNGWFRTGDMACCDEDGFVYLRGRKKDIAIIGGKNVSLKEVDELLYEHPKIINAISIAVVDEISSNKIVACIQIDPKGALSSKEELFKFFQEKVASFKCPKEICLVDSFPLGGGGKILRAKVKEKYLKGEYDDNRL
jgi:oxalate---CoA ligase